MSQAARSSGLVAAGLGWGLALGVAAGTLLIAPAMDTQAPSGVKPGSGVETATDTLAQDQVADANQLLADEGGAIVAGTLDDVAVTIIRTAEASEEDAAGVRWMANAAGASNSGSIKLTEKFFDRDAADELSSVIANTLPAGAQLSVENRSPGTHAGESFATALTDASADDRALVLESLEQSGFVELRGQTVPAEVIVVVAGAEHDGDDDFAAQLLKDFAAALGGGSDVVLTTQGAAPTVPGVTTVSHAETEAGRVRAVLAAGEFAEQQ